MISVLWYKSWMSFQKSYHIWEASLSDSPFRLGITFMYFNRVCFHPQKFKDIFMHSLSDKYISTNIMSLSRKVLRAVR